MPKKLDKNQTKKETKKAVVKKTVKKSKDKNNIPSRLSGSVRKDSPGVDAAGRSKSPDSGTTKLKKPPKVKKLASKAPTTRKSKKSKDKKVKKAAYFWAVGRRKSAVARVRLYDKKGPILVNKKPIEQYFPGEVAKVYYLEPFRTTNTLTKLSATIKVVGGGKSGQLVASVHGLSRALVKYSPDRFKSILRKHGFLTRDSRIRERRKVGKGGSARRGRQSPKR